ncbi:MAG: WbqC family protein [Clostridiales bacterium]|nr:WbqC family protein [Clostridiales bacterium]
MIAIGKSADVRRIPFEAPILVAHQPEFMPWLGFISKAAMGDVYILLDSVDFRKRYFQHRNKIRIISDQGWIWLIIPLVRSTLHGDGKLISRVKIAKGSWKEEHLRAIKFSYSKAPYFSEIYPEIQELYQYNGDSLAEFNTLFIKYAFKKFNINIPAYRTSDIIARRIDISGQKTELILSMCQAVGAKTFVSGPYGKTYLEKEKFVERNMKLVFQRFEHPTYTQTHGEFIPCMSFIDLLFNHGPQSIDILGKSNWEE